MVSVSGASLCGAKLPFSACAAGSVAPYVSGTGRKSPISAVGALNPQTAQGLRAVHIEPPFLFRGASFWIMGSRRLGTTARSAPGLSFGPTGQDSTSHPWLQPQVIELIGLYAIL